MKRKLLALVFVLAFAISSFAALGVSGVSAGPVLTTAILSPEGTNTVDGPDEATGGAITAFTQVTGAGVEIANVDVSFD